MSYHITITPETDITVTFNFVFIIVHYVIQNYVKYIRDFLNSKKELINAMCFPILSFSLWSTLNEKLK